MSEREGWGRETAPRDGSEAAREAQVQALFVAAYRPLEPSDAFQRRVAEVVAERDAQRVRRRAWGPRPLGWASVTAIGLVLLLVAVGLTRFRIRAGGPPRIQAPLTA